MLSHGTSTHVPSRGLAAATPAELAGAAFIAGYANPRTRSSYTIHLRDWFSFCASHDFDPMTAQRMHVELWARELDTGAARLRTRTPRVRRLRRVGGLLRSSERGAGDVNARCRTPDTFTSGSSDLTRATRSSGTDTLIRTALPRRGSTGTHAVVHASAGGVWSGVCNAGTNGCSNQAMWADNGRTLRVHVL